MHRRSHIRRGWALLLVLMLTLGAAGVAGAKRKKKDDVDEGKQFTVSESMGKKLTTALEALQAEQYPEAEKVLKALEGRAERLNPYERALIYQMLGYLESGRESYEKALVYFEKCIKEKALPHAAQSAARYNIAQLYLATEQYEKAVSSLEAWFRDTETPNAAAYYLLAIAYYQIGKIEQAIIPAKKSVDLAKKPREPWLQLLVGLYYEARQFEHALEPLEVLIQLNPKKDYWKQLSSLYAHLGKEEQSLAVMQLAYTQKFLELDRELRALGQLYLYHALPYRAALVLEEGLEKEMVDPDDTAWEMLANSWLLAREYDRAVDPLRKAAELSPEGNLYARLGAVFIEREQWGEASTALDQAVNKGELNNPGTTNLLLGISFYHQSKISKARKHFNAALPDETTGKSAAQWLSLMAREAAERENN
jgi:tetratricopeptide (TPR) repeat protein